MGHDDAKAGRLEHHGGVGGHGPGGHVVGDAAEADLLVHRRQEHDAGPPLGLAASSSSACSAAASPPLTSQAPRP